MRLSLLLILFALGPTLMAQQATFSTELPSAAAHQARFHPKGFLVRKDATNSFYLTVAGKNRVKRFLVHADGRNIPLLDQSDEKDGRFAYHGKISPSALKIYRKFHFLDGMVQADTLIEAMYDKRHDKVVVLTTCLKSGVTALSDTILLRLSEEPVFTYARNGRLNLLTHRTHTAHFNLYSFHPELEPVKRTLEIEDTVSSSLVSRFSLANKVLVIPNNQWVPVHADFKQKAYIQEELFTVTALAGDKSIYTVSIDLDDFNYEVRQFDPFETRGNGEASSACLLIDSLLLTAGADHSGICLTAFNSNTGKMLGRKKITAKNFEEIQTTRVEKNGDFWASSNLMEISFGEFLKKALRNRLSITGHQENGQLYLSLGTNFDRVVSASFLGNLLTLWTLGFAENRNHTSVSFQTALSLGDFEITAPKPRHMVWDKILMHLWGNRNHYDDFRSISSIYMNGFYFLGYYNHTSNKYFVYRFDEKAE